MFLHVGENISILKKDIVAIIDKDSVDNSKETKIFIDNMIKDGLLSNENINDVKTYIITCTKKIDRNSRQYIRKYGLYTSNISSTTLSKRNKDIYRIDWR